MTKSDFKMKMNALQEVKLQGEDNLRGIRILTIHLKDPWSTFNSLNHQDFAVTLRLIHELGRNPHYTNRLGRR